MSFFNNLLTVVMGNVGLLSEDPTLSESAHLAVQEILGAATRAAGLVRQLLAFSRRQVLVPKVLDLNAMLGEMRELLGGLAGERVNMTLALAPGALLLLASRRLR